MNDQSWVKPGVRAKTKGSLGSMVTVDRVQAGRVYYHYDDQRGEPPDLGMWLFIDRFEFHETAPDHEPMALAAVDAIRKALGPGEPS